MRRFTCLLALFWLLPLFALDYKWEGTDDQEELRALFLTSFLQNYQDLRLTPEDLATPDIAKVLNDYWEEERASRESGAVRWLVAKEGAELVGYASFNLEKTPLEVFVQLLYVKPEYQRRGIGKQLLFSIFQHEPAIQKLSLITRRVNRSAIAFYQSAGFVENLSIDKKANIDKELCIQLEKGF